MTNEKHLGNIAEHINKCAFVKNERIINEDNGEILNKNAIIDLTRLEKGAEGEVWSTIAYNVPALGDEHILLNNVQTKIQNTRGQDKITFPTLTRATPEIALEGETPSGSVSAVSPGYVEINTKNLVKSFWSLSLKQQASMTFDLMAEKMRQQKSANLTAIEKSVQRILILLVPSAHRQERASGDAMTLTLLQNAWQYILDDGGDWNNLAMTIDPATTNKLKAVAEATSGRLPFLDWGYSRLDTFQTGMIPKVEGFQVLFTGQLPGVEDDWSAIETTETHLAQLLFDKRSVAVGIDAQDDILVLPVTSGQAGYQVVLQTYYGAGALNVNHLAGIKMYEA